MSLLSRLVDPDRAAGEKKIVVHQFAAELGEFQRNEIPKSKIVADFELTAQEETQLDNFIILMEGGNFDRIEFEDVMLMGEKGFYTQAEILTRLNP
jgi:hypothetical protein